MKSVPLTQHRNKQTKKKKYWAFTERSTTPQLPACTRGICAIHKPTSYLDQESGKNLRIWINSLHPAWSCWWEPSQPLWFLYLIPEWQRYHHSSLLKFKLHFAVPTVIEHFRQTSPPLGQPSIIPRTLMNSPAPNSVTHPLIYFFSHPTLCFSAVAKGKDVKCERAARWTATAKLQLQDHPVPQTRPRAQVWLPRCAEVHIAWESLLW